MMAFEAKSEPFDKVLRAKGTAWLCTQQEQGALLSIAGGVADTSPGAEWWAETPKEEWPEGQISKAYRKLAGKWHPDRFRTPEEKKDAELMFMRIAAGYEVLRDDESRKEYDYMLDHPEE